MTFCEKFAKLADFKVFTVMVQRRHGVGNMSKNRENLVLAR